LPGEADRVAIMIFTNKMKIHGFNKKIIEAIGYLLTVYNNKLYFCSLINTSPCFIMHNIKCSLIISTYNWPQALELCLKSVSKQKHLPNEVIIADDGSGEETRLLINELQKWFPVPLLHAWHQDLGFRKTIILNKAIQKSSFEYIIQADGDVILDKHFIGDHLNSAEPATFIRGTRAMLTPEKTEQIIASQQIDLSPFSKGVKHRNNALRLFALKWLGARKEWSSNSVRGSNLSFWKADFIRVNGYNNAISGWGHEDEELAARFINAGIIKKIVKLYAVQYHLYHSVTSKKDEPWQRELVEKTKREKMQFCTNGYQQAGV
jgi:glycosyltransferase involved in cell wall biosynthesis